MKKIICPKCGQVDYYYMKETVKRGLIFNAEEKPIDRVREEGIYNGKIKRCLICDKEVQVIEEGE